MFTMSNGEFMILSLVWELEAASGYQINTIVKARGYQEWAEIGMTSIYTGLKKLEKKDLILGKLTKDENTRGPVAKEFSLTAKGLDVLKKETARGLSETRERDRRFDLAVSVIDILPVDKSFVLVGKRKNFLQAEYDRLARIINGQQGISFKGKLLFKHTLHFITSEMEFLAEMLENWNREIMTGKNGGGNT